MAEGGRYGHHGSGYYNKRKYDDNNEHDYKRQRTQSEQSISIEDELESTIYRLGESDSKNQMFSIENSIEKAVQIVTYQLVDKRQEIIDVMHECATKLPEKLSIYSTFLGILNIRNPNFSEDLIDSFVTSLKRHLKSGQFTFVQRLIRFISDLVNVNFLSTKSVLKLYQAFVETINDTGSSQMRTDFYVYCVLSSIPWNAKLLYEKHGPEFDDILDNIKKYLGKRQKDYMPLIKVWSNDDPHPQEEYLDCLWIQIKKLDDNDWNESQIYRPYVSFENMLINSVPHDFPYLSLPEFSEETSFPLPRAIFRMFDYTDVPEEFILPGAHSIERFLVEEQLHSTISTYFLDRKLCANKLLNLRITPKIPLNYMIIEVIFSHLFTLPKAPQLELFYGALLLELCRLEPNFMPQVLAQATELLFERLPQMKTSCIERFSSWFAYHLSNFQYKWSWEDWKETVEEEPESPRNKFLRDTLIRCMRLSYHQRMVDTIPESMQQLVPKNPKPTYKYVSDEASELEGVAVANKLLELFKNRAIPEDIFQVLRDIPDNFNESDNDYEAFNPLKIEVFTSTLLFFGNKSFSHAFAALAKYHMIFKMLVEGETSQIAVLKALHEVWQNHQQMMVVMVDKMLKTQIVECASVANWIFSDTMKSDLTCFYVWEILHATISRMNKQVDKLQHEYVELDQKYKKSTMDMDMDAAHGGITEEEIDQKLDTLNMLKKQQKELFLIIIKKFFSIIETHFATVDMKTEDNKPLYGPYWLKWIGERFEDFLLIHNEEILPYLNEFRDEVIKSDTPKYILKTFKMFSAFKL